MRDSGTRRQKRIYLDYHASTPVDPRVVEAMLPYFLECYANPSSAIHEPGREAAEAVERAREQVAAAIGALAGEIVFTSGATESNNLAILGVARAAPPDRRKILVSAIEHKSVLEPAKYLRKEGFEVHLIPVDRDGLLDLGALADLVDESTLLVSVQAANNEIGTIQPVLEVVQLARRVGALVHCDAAQALGRMPIDVKLWGVDFISLSAHKCYGPKGVGALYVAAGPRTAPIEPVAFGGGHEVGLRPGTLNVPGIVGFGKACEIAIQELPIESERVARLRNRFEREITAAVEEVRINGAATRRLPGTSSLLIHGVDAEALVARAYPVILSSGSACSSGALEPSHVLTAIGLSRQQAYSTVRLAFGRFTSDSDLPVVLETMVDAISQIRSTVLAGHASLASFTTGAMRWAASDNSSPFSRDSNRKS